jgi:hypothetical protein
VIAAQVKRLVTMIRAVKADTHVPELQRRFLPPVQSPLPTPQE